MKSLSTYFVLLLVLPLILASNAYAGPLEKKLIEAVLDGRDADVRAALDQGANVNALDEEYGTSLTAAIAYNHFDTAKLLITRGANVNQAGYAHNTPLILAADTLSPELVRMLIEKGADVNLQAVCTTSPPPCEPPGPPFTALMIVDEKLQRGGENVMSLEDLKWRIKPFSTEEIGKLKEIERMLKAAGAK